MIRETEPLKPSTRLKTLGDKLPEVARHRLTEPAALSRLVRGDLDWIVMKALEKDRARRYQTANDLARDIERHRNNEPVVARPPSNFYRFQKLVRRNGLAFAAASTMVAILVIGLGVSTWLFMQEKRALRAATQAEGKAKQAQQQTTDQLYQSYLAQARANRLSGRPGRRFDSLEAVRKAATIRPSPELRDEAIAALALLDLRVAKQWEPPQETDLDGIQFDPKLERYALKTKEGNVSVRRVKDDQELGLVPCRDLGLYWLLGFSPDGRYLVMTTRKTQNCVWDITRGEWAFENLPGRLDFDPKGGSFAYASTNGTISLYDLDSRQQTRRTEVRASVGPASFDPCGLRLACFNGKASSVEVWDLETEKLTVTALMPDECSALAWSADGRFLAVGCNDNCAYILDGQSGARVADLKGHQMVVTRLAFNHAGNLLATTSWDGTIRLWDPIRGLPLLVFQDASGAQMQFSEDDRHLAYFYFFQTGRQFGFLEVAASPVYRRLPISDPRSYIRGLDFSPDGRLIVAGGTERICFLDIVSGREIGFLAHTRCASVLFHPDGNSLLTSGELGLAHWPIERARRGEAEEVRIGSPEPMHPEVASIPIKFACQSADGATVAAGVNFSSRTVVLNAGSPTKLISLTHTGASSIAISPDGRWVATGTWRSTDVKIWEATTGRLERTLPLRDTEQVLFSPDGQWLITSGTEAGCQLWEVGSWRRRYSNPAATSVPRYGELAFSPDSRLFAIGRASDDIRLLETVSGHPIARLEAPDRFVLSRLCFSKDGSHLAALDTISNVHVWDLRSLRQLLKSMNLDWDLPPYPAEDKAHRPKSVRIEVITADAKQ